MHRDKKFIENLPNRSEIEKVAKEVQKNTLLRLMVFADSLVRYIQIKLKDNVNWLQVIALLYIISRGGAIVPSHLARLTFRSNYSMTRLVDEMAKDGLVIRVQGEKDRRTMMIKITKKGLSVMIKNLNYIHMAQDSVLSSLTAENIETLTNLTRILIPTLIEKIGERPNAWSYYFRGVGYNYFDRKKDALNEFETCINCSKNASLIQLAKDEIKKIQEMHK